ncbi:autotransporter domain-containing protein [Sphingomonas sp.]|uniref:autotransporter domain-containing protein n=1 Tax=Sphingomonas sp. TaxID=28214 RepID=UPI001EC00D2A|nr:autotransporter domain-containing protein [Sphingomonas sp.]MBX3594626.1 autotransporter domain-containing protein [Sphingomonas sp.]
MNSIRNRRAVRASLFLSAAGIGLLATPAFAQSGPLDPGSAVLEAQSGAMPVSDLNVDAAELDPQIVIGYPGTPTTAIDPNNVTGVGQMIVDNQNGTIGLCTGTLINPRTVIFAAHCVNSRAATAYGSPSGGTAIGFGFNSNNNQAGNSAFGIWLNGNSTNAKYASSAARNMFNVSQVFYNSRSTEADANGFLYADVATAVLDTPAAGIPTWAMLFSPLPNPGTIGANGTGYHVTIEGYGRNGTGDTGSVNGVDYRRRIADNMLGALTSLNVFEQFLFGPGGATNNPQNLYWIDFDDPRRFTTGGDPRDFNAFRDNAQANEGITASGDSGGPLILDTTYARQLVIGVLSGGYTRFFSGAPANGYGTASFYQPLYLYWDWIAANNPYHYVGAVAGDGSWTDPTHWVSKVDPNYYVLSGGNLVNGVPTNPGGTTVDTSGQFGQICFQSGGVSDCYDTATGQEIVEVRPKGTGDIGDTNGGGLTVGVDTLDLASTAIADGSATDAAASVGTSLFAKVEDPSAQADGSVTAQALPTATLTNGLPGATNFVPNNSDGNRATGVAAQYFDVTLSATGTTTLSSAVTIDNLTLNGAGAGLTITSAGSLTSLMNVSQITGTMRVDGQLTSKGDYMIVAGGLSGTGQINAPYVTNVAGVISPGTSTTVGTLTFNGNLVLGSGTGYIVNLANGASDLIAVKKVNGTSGVASVGGVLQISYTSALRAGQSYTILSAEGGRSGTFATPSAISAILTPTLSYTTNAVVLNIAAGSYTNVVSPSNPIAYAYAQLLDQNRSRASSYDGLYGPLDLQNASTILSTLNGLAPAVESTVQTLGIAAVDSNATFIRNRMQSLDPRDMGGTLARYGQPVQVAAVGLSSFATNVKTDMTQPSMVQEGALPEDVSAFVSGGYLTGDGAAMTGVGGRDSFNGWYVGGGIEVATGENGFIGFAFNYSDLDGTASLPGQTVKSSSLQGTLYAKSMMGGLTVDAQLTAGAVGANSKRVVNFLGTPYTLAAKDNALVISSEVGIGADLGSETFSIAPRVAARATQIGFGSALETGGPMALNVQRPKYTSLQGRAGLTLSTKSGGVRPFLTGTYVHEFQDQPNSVGANLVGGIGGGTRFALNGQDKDWGEISGGLTMKTGSVDLSIAADTTVSRSDLSAQTYRGSVTFHF